METRAASIPPIPRKGASSGRCLIVELWGVGDAVLMTAALQGLLARGWEVTVLGKPHARLLLQSTYPQVEFIEIDAPWTAFRGKYRLWRWPWGELGRVLGKLRARRFDAALSVRKEPRDAVVMALAGARRRIGFRTPLGTPFLTEAAPVDRPDAHRVEDWWELAARVSGAEDVAPRLPPRLSADRSLLSRFDGMRGGDSRPRVALHCGARIAVRRWPEAYFRELIGRMRLEFDFRLELFPDPDGYGAGLRDLADATIEEATLPEMVAALEGAAAFIGNDSGPAHVSAALGVPTAALFGPQRPEWFRPWGEGNLAVARDLCVYRPCADRCRFPEPFCLTRLVPEGVWNDVRPWLDNILKN